MAATRSDIASKSAGIIPVKAASALALKCFYAMLSCCLCSDSQLNKDVKDEGVNAVTASSAWAAVTSLFDCCLKGSEKSSAKVEVTSPPPPPSLIRPTSAGFSGGDLLAYAQYVSGEGCFNGPADLESYVEGFEAHVAWKKSVKDVVHPESVRKAYEQVGDDGFSNEIALVLTSDSLNEPCRLFSTASAFNVVSPGFFFKKEAPRRASLDSDMSKSSPETVLLTSSRSSSPGGTTA